MDSHTPHYLLFAHTDSLSEPAQWKVVLKRADGSHTFEASDSEPEARGERLELLAVIRGLEALDEPSRVTLVTSSRNVRRGLLNGLDEWRKNDWAWEWYGRMVPVKNRDLWQRLDRALKFHRVECRRWRLDAAHFTMERPQAEPPTAGVAQPISAPAPVHPGRQSKGAVRPGPRRQSLSVPAKGARRESLISNWIQQAGHYLLRLSGASDVPSGAGRRPLCAAE